jgi:hypothetical protein
MDIILHNYSNATSCISGFSPSQPLLCILHLSNTRISVLLFLLIHRKVHLAQQVLEARIGA